MRLMLLALIRAYQRWVSPLIAPACRYVPTCSQYAAEAMVAHGVLRGGVKALWRVLRCHPLARGGYDPVDRPSECRCRGACQHLQEYTAQ
jgi:putative membrane protein insertion efficiency factor